LAGACRWYISCLVECYEDGGAMPLTKLFERLNDAARG
jgi:hypothetical protein